MQHTSKRLLSLLLALGLFLSIANTTFGSSLPKQQEPQQPTSPVSEKQPENISEQQPESQPESEESSSWVSSDDQEQQDPVSQPEPQPEQKFAEQNQIQKQSKTLTELLEIAEKDGTEAASILNGVQDDHQFNLWLKTILDVYYTKELSQQLQDFTASSENGKNLHPGQCGSKTSPGQIAQDQWGTKTNEGKIQKKTFL